MTTDKELIDGLDADPLPERKYQVKGDHVCFKCGRTLKGKIAYLDFKNNLICQDNKAHALPLESVLCEFFTSLTQIMNRYNLRLTKDMIKKLDRILKTGLE